MHFYLIKFWLFRSNRMPNICDNGSNDALFSIFHLLLLFIHKFYTDAFLCHVIIALCSLFESFFYHIILFHLQQSHSTMEQQREFGSKFSFNKNWKRMRSFIHKICSLFMNSAFKLTYDFDPERVPYSKDIWFAHWMEIILELHTEPKNRI